MCLQNTEEHENHIYKDRGFHAVQKLSGPVPEHGMDLSGAGHTRVFCKARAKRVKKLQLLYHAVQKLSGPVPEHGMDLSGAGHTRVFCKARAKRVKKLQQL